MKKLSHFKENLDEKNNGDFSNFQNTYISKDKKKLVTFSWSSHDAYKNTSLSLGKVINIQNIS